MSDVAQEMNAQPGMAEWSWLLFPPKDQSTIPLRKGFIRGVFVEAAKRLGFKHGEDAPNVEKNDADGYLPNVLMDTGAARIVVDRKMQVNEVNPDTLEGGGSFTAVAGHKPFLMLLYLQKRWREEFNTSEGDTIEICDGQLDLINFTNWESLQPFIERFEFDAPSMRVDAEALGLVVSMLDYDAIGCTEMDAYF
jgi:hypothetical protein